MDAAILFGATATGKTALAVELARHVPVEVISADSRQVYRHLDIGTAKPTPDERAATPHHLVDFLELDETYNAARFAEDAWRLCGEIRARGRVPLIVGGAGFYLRVLRDGLFEAPFSDAALREVRRELETWSLDALRDELARRDPQRRAAIHENDRYRLSRALEICIASGSTVTALTAAKPASERRFVAFHLQLERGALHHRIERRTAAVLDGWIDEVRRLLETHESTLPGFDALGYPHVVAHVRGTLARDELAARVNRDTRRFARHQDTWFRKTPAQLVLRAGEADHAARLVERLRALLP